MLESTLDSKEIKPVHPKGNQPWIFIGRTDAEAEAPNTLATWCEELTHLKRPNAGKDWGLEKGMTEDKMVVSHHQVNGHEFEQTPGDSEGQGSLACCSRGVTNSQTWLSNWTTITQASQSNVECSTRDSGERAVVSQHSPVSTPVSWQVGQSSCSCQSWIWLRILPNPKHQKNILSPPVWYSSWNLSLHSITMPLYTVI